MKKILLLSIIVLSFCIFPSLTWATPRTVTITWTMPDTTDVQGYKVYYADNSSMTNKTWHNDCSTPVENPSNTFTITCNNVDLIDEQTYYFAIAAEMANNSEIISNAMDAMSSTNTTIQITPVQNFNIATPTGNNEQ